VIVVCVVARKKNMVPVEEITQEKNTLQNLDQSPPEKQVKRKRTRGTEPKKEMRVERVPDFTILS
jgi:hypothetical protein